MKIKSLFALLLILCAWLIFTGAKYIKSSSFSATETGVDLQHEVTVTLKLVQVNVVDKNGNPVMDLDPADFEVYDNNRRQTISAFEKHMITGQAKPQPGQTIMSRKFFFLFDFAFNDLGGIAMAKRAVAHFIDSQVQPTDEIGVLSYSGIRGLELHEYLTRDHARVREILGDLGYKETLGRAGMLMEELVTEKGAKMDIPDKMAAKIISRRKESKDAFVNIAGKAQYGHEVQAFSSALKAFAAGLRYIPGYKYIVLFSMGVPDFLMYQMADQMSPQLNKFNLSASDASNLRLRYDDMIRDLASSNSPVIAVNVEGLSARFKDVEFEQARYPMTSGDYPFPFIDRAGRGNTSLMEVAKISGGKYIGETNDTEKIAEEIQNLTGSYYVLGYAIDEKTDGKYHKLEVKVKGDSYRVQYQKGYYNPKPYDKFSNLEKDLHLIDLALGDSFYLSDPIPFPLAALVNPRNQRNNLVLIAQIPQAKLSQAAGEEMEVVALVFDEGQNLLWQQRAEVDASRRNQGTVYCIFSSSLSPGEYECRVVMRNMETGRAALASSSIHVPRRFEPGLKLYSPLLLIPGEKGSYWGDSISEEGETYPALNDYYSFDISQYSPLVDEVDQNVEKLVVLLPCSIIQFEPKSVLLIAQLVHISSGEKKTIPVSLVNQEQQEDTITFQVEVKVGKLPPGQYTLYIFAEDRETHQIYSYTSSIFTTKEPNPISD